MWDLGAAAFTIFELGSASETLTAELFVETRGDVSKGITIKSGSRVVLNNTPISTHKMHVFLIPMKPGEHLTISCPNGPIGITIYFGVSRGEQANVNKDTWGTLGQDLILLV